MREVVGGTSDAAAPHPAPLERLGQFLRPDRGDLAVLFVYTVVAGLFGLAVPLAAQALVNTIAAGFSLQPLFVLTMLVLGGLLCAGVLKLLQLSLVETLNMRLFARVALELAQRLPRLRHSALENAYAPELVNRFFDVLTVQKTLSKLLLDGLAAVLQALVGLALIAVYNPLLLGFAVVVLLTFAFIAGVLGLGGLRSSLAESAQKYRVAGWLEELARCQTSLKMNGDGRALVGRTDALVQGWLAERRRHFRVLFRQAGGNYLFQALASAGTLGIGGWLVIHRQLTLGQLVAAELVVVSVLAAFDKLIQQAEKVYDLLTAVEKIGHVLDLPTEREGGRFLLVEPAGAGAECRAVRFAYRPGQQVLADLTLSIRPGERVSLVGASGAGKSTLAALLCGLEEPSHGTIEVNGVEVRSLSLESLRRVVSMVGDEQEIFSGTIEENVLAGRSHVTHEDVRWALEVAQLADDLATFPQGLATPLVSGGRNLSHGQAQRLLLARAILDHPQLLILDEPFTGVDERTKVRILDALHAPEHPWTIIHISHDGEVVRRSERAHVLLEGHVVESGSPVELLRRPGSALASLFPDLARQVRADGGGPRLALDDVPGLGPARLAALAAAGVRTVDQLAALSSEQLAALPGIGGGPARRITEFLRQHGLAA